MTLADRLAAIRVDLSEHHPYRPVFQEGDICPACSRFGNVGVVPWPCGPVRMADALDAVLALHQPMRIYDECDHAHEEGDPGVVDTGEFVTCEDEYLYSICRSCCVENPEWPEQAEWCADKHDHRRDGHCATVAAITDALGEDA